MLSDNHLTSLPDWLWNLNLLQTLNLSGNLLTSLSSQIGNLRALRNLVLSRNQLTALPQELFSIPGLQTLHLGSNLVTTLPPGIFNPPHRYVWIENNPLSLRVRVDHFVRYNIEIVGAALVGTAIICTGILSIGLYRNVGLSGLASSVYQVTGYIFEKVFTV